MVRPHVQCMGRMPESLGWLRQLLCRNPDGQALSSRPMGTARRAQAYQRGELEEASPVEQGCESLWEAPARILRVPCRCVRQSGSGTLAHRSFRSNRGLRTPRLAAADKAPREHQEDAADVLERRGL